jgi:uncharacterized membrane protein
MDVNDWSGPARPVVRSISADDAFVAMVPLFLGVVVALPVLGHGTWHLYRRLVAPAMG